EAMWGVDSAEAQMLLRYALTDSDHRAVGNALLGLYYLGDCSVIPKIVKMAAHEAGLFRAAAAWVMGETGDPRFIKVLVRMLADLNTIVRKRAFAALGRIKAAAAIAGQGAQWRMGGVI